MKGAWRTLTRRESSSQWGTRMMLGAANRLNTWLTHTCTSPVRMLPVSCALDELRDTLLTQVGEAEHSWGYRME